MPDMEHETQKANESESLDIQIDNTENGATQGEIVADPVTVDEIDENIAPETESVENSESDSVCKEAIKALKSDIAMLGEQIAGLDTLFKAKILHTEHEEKIVDQMHRELQKYKEDMYSQLVRPILLDIIEIRDSILKMSSVYRNKPEGEQNIPLETFETYASDVQILLEKNNIEIYKSETGADFVPVRQRVIKKITTTDENLHGKIAESLSDGYSYMGKPISPEKIAVSIYEPQHTQPESIKQENN